MQPLFLFLKALAVFAGTIIGVGIFGLPYVASKTGFPIVAGYFLGMTVLVVAVHLMFAKVSHGTATLHRLPGYIGEYLGEGWKKLIFFTFIVGLMGALLAYLLVGGEFLRGYFLVFFGGSYTAYTLLFWAVGSFLIFMGVSSIARAEMFLQSIFLILLTLFFFRALPHINANNFSFTDFRYAAFPYGVILFSLWGSALIPEIKEMVGSWRMLRNVIIAGITLSTLLYLWFIITVFGASGEGTTKEAISGFAGALGDGIVRLGFIFGFITTFTSFITLGLTAKRVLWYDFNVNKHIAGVVATGLPLLLFFLGLREFLDIIGLVGAYMLGVEGIMIVFLYKKFKEKMERERMNPFLYALALLFIAGVGLETYYFFITK